MGSCTIQLVRVPRDEPAKDLDPKDRLWWVTPATEVTAKQLMTGEDVTSQQCADCGLRGTKKRVRIHCLQHFCKYTCQCGLLKTSRDAVYNHQVSKCGSEEHGGPRRRIYCIDEATYPEFCEALGWDDPLHLGRQNLPGLGSRSTRQQQGLHPTRSP